MDHFKKCDFCGEKSTVTFSKRHRDNFFVFCNKCFKKLTGEIDE